MPYIEFRKDIFRLMDNVENGAGRISSFVANLREFAISDGDRLKKYVDLRAINEKVLAICGKQLKRAVKSIEINIPRDLPEVYTAPYAMEQVLINLLMNAAQAADKEDSCIKLNASIGSTWREHLIIEVIDNGCGFDEKTKDRLFDPFYTTKLPGEGTGLGLYVCHNLVQGMGGQIEVESELGRGSKFTIMLPDKDNRKEPR
jgi:signal transduction histidine kinase